MVLGALVNSWIPTSFAIPAKSMDLLVTVEEPGFDPSVQVASYNADDGSWYDCNAYPFSEDASVTAWMELPEPFDYLRF